MILFYLFYKKSIFNLVHFGVGVWGIIAAPLFKTVTGIIYTGSVVSMELLGWHILAGLAILVWAGITLLLIYLSFIPCSSYPLKGELILIFNLANIQYTFSEFVKPYWKSLINSYKF